MRFYLDCNNKNWPAQERFCRSLRISFSWMKGEGRPFSIRKAFIAYMLSQPWHGYRLVPAMEDYVCCNMYINSLYWEAENVRTAVNGEIVDHILMQAGRDLIRESPADWPEISGLATQKLHHLDYHDDIPQYMKGKAAGVRKVFTSDNIDGARDSAET